MVRERQDTRTSRFLRAYVLGSVALAFGYLVLHVTEPLRLDLGDPGADADVLLGRFGGCGLVTLRLLALAGSAVAIAALYDYARRTWNETVGLLAAAFAATNLLWLMYADSLDGMPVAEASAFVALAALARALATRKLGYSALALVAACACFASSADYWLFLPAAAWFALRRSEHDRSIAIVAFAIGCAGGLALRAWASPADAPNQLAEFVISHAPPAHIVVPAFALVRRFTVLFTPMFWAAAAYMLYRAARTRSLQAAFGEAWLFVAALLSVLVYPRADLGQMLGAQAMLPFYAIGSALAVSHLLEHPAVGRGLAIAWLAFVPAWAGYTILAHPRSLLDRDDVARANAYLDAYDRDDFILSNLPVDGPVELAFGRHRMAAPTTGDAVAASRQVLKALAATGTDYAHAVVFKTRSALRAASKVVPNLTAIGARRVLHLGTLDVYRIERAAVLDAIARTVPVAHELAPTNPASAIPRLLGWGGSWTTKQNVTVFSLDGYVPCANPSRETRPGEPRGNACETMMTRRGLVALDGEEVRRAQLLVRLGRACDVRVTFELVAPAVLEVSVGDFTSEPCEPTSRPSFVIPQNVVHAGINTLTFTKHRFDKNEARADVRSLAIEPLCAPPS